MKSLKQAFLALGLVFPAFCGAAQAQTTVFFDDFKTWDSSKWSVYDGTHFLQRTQFGKTPTIGSEGTTSFAHFGLDSYDPDPAYTGKDFRGTEAQGPTFNIGSGMTFEARLRAQNLPPGIVFAFFTYNSRGVWPDTYLKDEIDFEFLTNFNANEMWLNIWDDWNPVTYGAQQSSRSSAAGLDKSVWNTYKIVWTDSAVKWYVNNVLIRTSTDIVPKDPMQLRFNIWAADDRWTTAYDANLKTATTASANQSYAMDVDWVKVSALSTDPNPKPTPTPTPPPGGVVGTGTGLAATYYDNKDFTGTTLNRVDPTVDFQWGYEAPAASMGINDFSVRWTGLVQAQLSETYTFTTRTDDGVRLWVNGQKLVDKWINQSPEEYSAQIALVAGQKYDIKLEYYENLDGAVAQLFWSSAHTTKQIVPKTQLYSSADTTPPTATILAPVKSAILKLLSSISGTASDSGSGVKIVYVRLRRLSDGYYWNGTAWGAASAIVTATGTTSWSWTPPALADGSYTVQIRAEDVARNYFVTALQTFSIDKTLPTATITAPLANKTYTSLTSVTGTASDSGSGLSAVHARLRRLSDGYYWNGTAWATPLALVRVTGTTSWNWTPPALPIGKYTIQVRASDKAKNLFYTAVLPFSISNTTTAASVSSGVQLSDAQASGDEITLFFTGALGAEAHDATTWQLNAEGEAVDISGVAVDVGTVRLRLTAPLKAGSTVRVNWPQLRDAQGNAVGGDWQGAAR